MEKLKFPLLSKVEQQSTFGAYGSSTSDLYTVDGGWLDTVYIGFDDGGSGGSGGGMDDWGPGPGGYTDTGGSYGDDYYYGGGGSGSNPDGGGDPVTLTNAGDMDTQVGNMCTFEALRFANTYDGGSENLDTLVQEVLQELGTTSPLVEGMTVDQFNQSMNYLFDNVNQLSTDDQVQKAIDDGHMVMSIMVDGSNGHAVVITGYDADTNQYQYADPQTGTENNWADSSNFDANWEVYDNPPSTGGGSTGSTGSYDYDYGYY